MKSKYRGLSRAQFNEARRYPKYRGLSRARFDLVVTAHHEAGHAVAAVIVFRPFGYVSIERNYKGYGSKGHIDYANTPFFHKNKLIGCDEQLTTTMAGAFAQRRFAPRTRWRHDAMPDQDLVIRNLYRWCDETGEVARAHLNYLHLKAKEIVEQNWRHIERVAAGLLKHGSLDESEVRRIMHRWQRVADAEGWCGPDWRYRG